MTHSKETPPIKRSHLSLLLLAVLALLLSACVAQAPAAPAAEEEQMEAEATPMAAEEAAAGSEAEFERLLACVEENFPAESYFTNDLLPAADATWEPMDCTSVDSIKVGMPWVLNDEELQKSGEATRVWLETARETALGSPRGQP